MPHDTMRDRVFRMQNGCRTLSSVIGQTPPFARVAAMTAAESQVVSTEHSCTDRKKLSFIFLTLASIECVKCVRECVCMCVYIYSCKRTHLSVVRLKEKTDRFFRENVVTG